MYAIIEAAGRQYPVREGEMLRLDAAGAAKGEQVVFDRVLMVRSEDDSIVGTPYVEGASVTGTVMGNGKNKKVMVFKYKPKKNIRKKTGHRQHFSVVRIEKIEKEIDTK